VVCFLIPLPPLGQGTDMAGKTRYLIPIGGNELKSLDSTIFREMVRLGAIRVLESW